MLHTKNRKRKATPKKRASTTMIDLAKNDADENIDSSSDNDQDNDQDEMEVTSEPDEPLELKRVRMAREYLEQLEGQSASGSSSSDDGDDDDDPLGRRLQRERQKRQGVLERKMADKVKKQVDAEPEDRIVYLHGHDLTPTCIAVAGGSIVSGSKDHSVFIWDIETQKKTGVLCKHWKRTNDDRTEGQVLAVACSDDGRFAAVGKRNGTVPVFDLRSQDLVQTFSGHKAPVTCLTFQAHSLDLFSGSEDRCIRHYDCKEMMYLETLYGHQFGVTSIDCFRKERPISVGTDRTARAWKLSEDSHLIFRGGAKIQWADTVSLIKDDWFMTGHQDGHLSLWMTEKKKAVATIENAHGLDDSGVGRSISSVCALRCSDLAASGSSDGYLRFWKARTGQTLQERSLDSICQISLKGYINAIAFADPKAKICVAAVGQEHRSGRWTRIPGAKNRIAIVKLYSSELDDGEEDDQSTNSPHGDEQDNVSNDQQRSSASSDEDSDDE
jgi:ribosomal RNA-processing protein 9